MAPTALTAGVILYEHANFLGNSAHLTADLPDLRDTNQARHGPHYSGGSARWRE